MNYYKQTNLPKEHNLWPTSTIAGGESPYIAFNTAKTSLHKVCKFKFKNTLIDIKLPCYKTQQRAYMTIETITFTWIEKQQNHQYLDR